MSPLSLSAENALSGVGYFPNLLYPFLVARGAKQLVYYIVWLVLKLRGLSNFFFPFQF